MQLPLVLLYFAVLVYSQTTNISDSLRWGTYRPNLYFGLRPQVPQSLMTGLMWFGTQDFQSVSSEPNLTMQSQQVLITSLETRHACDQGDGLDGYTWTTYDAREGGVQEVKDSKNNVKLTTEFLKVPGGQHGGSWAARIKGEPLDTGLLESMILSTDCLTGMA